MTLKQMLERRSAIYSTEIEAATSDAQLDALQTELRKLDMQIAEELRKNPQPEQAERTLAVNGDIPGVVVANAVQQRKDPAAQVDRFDTPEYRKAFMDYCRNGTAIPAEYRADQFTSINDAAAVVPTTIMNEIIKELKQRGQLFSRVRKTNIPGGVKTPILSLKPVARRVTENTPSDRQKVQANTFISFEYKMLECKVATSLLVGAATLPAFEAAIIPLITEAMIKQLEYEIIKGNGTDEMLGAAVDPRVPAGQIITLSPTDFKSYEGWKKKVFAKIPLAYRAGGLFIMAAGTFEGYIDGMVDANGQPVGRVNYNITDGTAERFGGKECLLVEEDVVASYDVAETGDVVAVFMRLEDYDINSNMEMATYRWLDQDTNQWVNKAILINDGKLLDAAGVVVVKKGA